MIEEIENSPRSKKIKKNFEEEENFSNSNLGLFSSKNEENNKENISDNIVNIAFGGKYNLNIASKIKEECNKNDNDFNKEEEYEMLKQNCVFKFDYIQPTLSELEKIKEEKLISDIDSMNKSYKFKNTQNFMNALNDIYLENYDGVDKDKLKCISEFSLDNSPDKLKKTFSNDESESEEIDNTLKSIKRPVSFILSENLSSNKFESQSTNFMSENYDDSSLNFNIESMNDNNNKISAFNIHNKNNPLSRIPKGNFNKFDLENLINQNLIITDEVVKILIIGDTGVGKTLFINKFCERPCEIHRYDPTLSLEINKKYFNHIGKYIKLELWDTNIAILNSNMIEAYYKISNGFILICDVFRFETINFLEKQLERISVESNTSTNIFIVGNTNNSKIDIRNNDGETLYKNNALYLEQLSEKYHANLVFLNISEVNKINALTEEFITGCLMKKKTKFVNLKKTKKSDTVNEGLIDKNLTDNSRVENLVEVKDSSPKKNRIENCIIF